MSPKIKLTYFPLRARAELTRLILKAGSIEFDEELITFEDWPKKKPTTIFGTLPMLSWDGEELTQSLTIARYVARKCGLAGDNDEEMARADMITEQIADVYTKYIDCRMEKNSDQKKQNIEKFVNEIFPNFLTKTEAVLNKLGGKNATGKSLSYGDLAVFLIFDTMSNAKEMKESGFEEVHGQILEKMSAATSLYSLYKEVGQLPKISAYINSRPEYPF